MTRLNSVKLLLIQFYDYSYFVIRQQYTKIHIQFIILLYIYNLSSLFGSDMIIFLDG